MRLGPLVAATTASLALVAACSETRRGLGDACLKGDDCLSGVCSSQVCVSAPPLATGTTTIPPAPPDAAPSGSSDGAVDASDAAEDAAPNLDAGDAE